MSEEMKKLKVSSDFGIIGNFNRDLDVGGDLDIGGDNNAHIHFLQKATAHTFLIQGSSNSDIDVGGDLDLGGDLGVIGRPGAGPSPAPRRPGCLRASAAGGHRRGAGAP